MLRILSLANRAQRLEAERLLEAPPVAPEIPEKVRRAIHDVRERGDAALRAEGKRDPLFMPDGSWETIAAGCQAGVRSALVLANQRVRAFHARQVAQTYALRLEKGGVIACVVHPVRRAGCLVPVDRPLAAITTAAVARIAGVPDVIVATPSRADATIAPELAAAARIAGATRVLLADGAHAVAALAVGTESVPRVDVLVGPGEAEVVEAKRQLAAEVRTDLPAGTLDLVVVADSSADPRAIAGEPGLAVVVTIDPAFPVAFERNAPALPVTVVLARALDEALAFADELAPQRLHLAIRDAGAALEKVPRAGVVHLGQMPLAAAGVAGIGSPVRPDLFLRRQQVVELGPEQLDADAAAIAALRG